MPATEPTHRLGSMLLSLLNRDGPSRHRVAIVGASLTNQAADELGAVLADPAWDVWGCNSLWRLHLDQEARFRADAWFELHPLSAQTAQERQDMDDCPVRLYVLDAPLQPRWRTYPLEAVRRQFGRRDFFTCTFCYQIALALLLGYETIGLYGVELMHGTARERTVELCGLTYWLGLAEGLGVTVHLPQDSQLLWHPKLYGYDYHAEDEYAQHRVAEIARAWAEREGAKARRRR